MPTVRKYAPAPGSNPEFDEIWRRTKEGLDAAGNPEGISDEDAREKLAEAFVKHGGKSYRAAPDRATPEPMDTFPTEPRQIVVPPPATDPYWYESAEDAIMFDHFVLSRRALGHSLQGGLLITGPAGSGKSRGVIKGIERINRERGLSIPLLVMNCPTLTDPGKWFGRREIDGDGTRYEKSDFIQAVESGSAILLDEFMRLHPSIHNPVMSLMDSTESVLLSDLNITVKRHPETLFIGTTNIGAAFGGTHRMDWAMRERWSFTIERDFPPRDEEIKILTLNHPGCDPDAATVLVDIAQKTRSLWETGDLRAPISTRTLDNAAFLVASGMTEREALGWTALPEYDTSADGSIGEKSDRASVKAIIEGRTGR